MDWTLEEVEATVSDYFQMLIQEMAGQSYNKAAHRRNLQRKLLNRSEAAIELKHQNISAILLELGCPCIIGYKPRRNYQGLLFKVVSRHIQSRQFDQSALAAVELPAATPLLEDFTGVAVAPPELEKILQDSAEPVYSAQRQRRGVFRDYLDREARNQALGKSGEEFVIQFERWKLISAGKDGLADKVEHVSAMQGDGLGFDVLSYEANGKEKLIEVKTTSFGKSIPFYVTRTELEVSKEQSEHFHLYRIFEFRKTPRLFSLQGALDTQCFLDPVTYRARFS